MKEKKYNEIRYFVDNTGAMLIVIDGKESIIIDIDGFSTYVCNINDICPQFDGCLDEINKSMMSNDFISKITSIAYEYDHGSSDNKHIADTIYTIIKDLLKSRDKKFIYPEELPYSVKVSICNRIELLRGNISKLNSIYKIISNQLAERLSEIYISQLLDSQMISKDVVSDKMEEIKNRITKSVGDITSDYIVSDDIKRHIDKCKKEINQLTLFLETQLFEGDVTD